jgi:hypothetical protein
MNRVMATAAIGLSLFATATQAAGPLYLQETDPARPYVWDTSDGPVPVWTDGGGAFTYDFDGTTPFITIERANQITGFALNEWSKVKTSTFRARIAGTIASRTGITDVNARNAASLYEAENGRGIWVIYDTDGAILEEYFGIPRDAVLGIAFPEWADENGVITEATALLNGYLVNASDPTGENFAGVFTHEFGHAINLSHAQVNGPMVYSSYKVPGFERYPGVASCVASVHAWDHWDDVGVNRADPAIIETMYPFIDTAGAVGREQSTITHPDDMAAVSNLYPAASYHSSRGSISGVLRLKDGQTEYSGINIIARNATNRLFDAVSAMSGDQTQGMIGPDGRFTINNLTPGQDYELYIEEILDGGYPTTPTMLVSQAEYWNTAESRDPTSDLPCDATRIRAQAGVTKSADITFNGYLEGVQFTPIVAAYLMDLSKGGRKAAGSSQQTAFIWDRQDGIEVLPSDLIANNSSMTRFGEWMTVNKDFDGNGISQASLRRRDGRVISLGDLNRDTCGGSSESGKTSSYGWAVDDTGRKAVGTAYLDKDGDGFCEGGAPGEIVPFIWDAERGMRQLNTSNLPVDELPWIRAHAISGNGEVVLGTAGFQSMYAWVNEGKAIDLTKRYGANSAYAVSADGHRVALNRMDPVTFKGKGVALWDYEAGLTAIGAPSWCRDVPYVDFFGGDLCETMTRAEIFRMVGHPPVEIFDMSDDGSVLIGRTGSFFTGFTGVIWIEQIGWMTWGDFFRKQGVIEASNTPFSNPISISGNGRVVTGGMVGVSFSWIVDLGQVFVCEKGRSMPTSFPLGLRAKIAAGARFGRCEHLGG